MRNKVIIFLFIFFLGLGNVLADKVTCNYRPMSGQHTMHMPFIIEYNTETKKYELGVETGDYKDNRGIVIGNYFYEGGPSTSYDYTIYLNETDYPISLTSNSCLSLYYCYSEEYGGGNYTNGTKNVYVFYDELQKEEFTKSVEKKIYSCKRISSTEVLEGKRDEIYPCKTYNEYYTIANQFLNDYKKNNDPNILNQFNSKIDSLKTLCNTITQYSDYDSSCLKSCLKLETDLQNLGVDQNIDRVCGFSERLLSWIANILRWIKYIVPVIVIVMGILDFIKAIAGDKDDEMKKAQSKFIKRLIAAALVFIIPLIIEFVLDKMGFGYDDCGLF